MKNILLSIHLFPPVFWPYSWHMEVPGPWVESRLQLWLMPQLCNTRSLPHCTGLGIELVPQWWPKLLKRQCQILNRLHYSRNTPLPFYIKVLNEVLVLKGLYSWALNSKGVEVSTLCPIENSPIIYSWPSISADSTFAHSTNCRPCSTIVFIIE